VLLRDSNNASYKGRAKNIVCTSGRIVFFTLNGFRTPRLQLAVETTTFVKKNTLTFHNLRSSKMLAF
jgi:hypothetical protein